LAGTGRKALQDAVGEDLGEGIQECPDPGFRLVFVTPGRHGAS
jgi:hypothetical protein